MEKGGRGGEKVEVRTEEGRGRGASEDDFVQKFSIVGQHQVIKRLMIYLTRILLSSSAGFTLTSTVAKRLKLAFTM